MAFAKINWRPDSGELRRFGAIFPIAMGLVGSLFYWGFGEPGFARFLWIFGLIGMITGLAGRPFGLPVYFLWMGFVLVVSTLLGYGGLAGVFFLAVTPIGILARLTGRDRLRLRARGEESFWTAAPAATTAETFERQY